jgi:hypothetical protein
VQICRHALAEYRGLRKKGLIDDAGESPEVKARTEELVAEAQAVLRAIETSIEGPWTPAGLYGIFAAGFLPVPYLWACRGEFPAAIDWRTRLVRGAVRLVDEKGVPLSVAQRVERALGNLKRTRPPS